MSLLLGCLWLRERTWCVSFCCDEDENECEEGSPCSHACHNAVGTYYCSCPRGLTISADGRTCQGTSCAHTNQIAHIDAMLLLELNCSRNVMLIIHYTWFYLDGWWSFYIWHFFFRYWWMLTGRHVSWWTRVRKHHRRLPLCDALWPGFQENSRRLELFRFIVL